MGKLGLYVESTASTHVDDPYNMASLFFDGEKREDKWQLGLNRKLALIQWVRFYRWLVASANIHLYHVHSGENVEV